MPEQFKIGHMPESAPHQSEITKDVEHVYRTLVIPEGGSEPRLEHRRINIDASPYREHFSETERLGDAQGVQLLKRRFEESDNVKQEIVEGKIFGQVLDGLFYDSMRSVFPTEGAVQVTSEFDDYLNRTDFVLNVSSDPQNPLFVLVDTTVQTADDNLRKKMLPKKSNLPNHAAFREDIKYFIQEAGQEFGLKNKPRVVVSLGYEGVDTLCKEFKIDRGGGFAKVSSYVFLSQVLGQIERQKMYTKENMTKFRDAGVLVGEYDAYVEALKPIVEESRVFAEKIPGLKEYVKNLPIGDVMASVFPIESDQVASADELALYRAQISPSEKVEKPKDATILMGGSNPILRLKKKIPENPPEEQKISNDQSAA